MFGHRVLPPLQPQTVLSSTNIPIRGQDTLLQHRIMTSDKSCDSLEKPINRRSSQASTSPIDKQHTNSTHLENLEAQQTSPIANQSSGRLIRKRNSSPSSIEELGSPERNLLSISTSSILTSTTDSPSQICLCQPDPKVPRPRNGNLASFSILILSSQYRAL